jgi:hypothetical protein
MFSLAEDLARTALSRKDMRAVLGCVILSAATLEAYINEVIEMWFAENTVEARALRKLDTQVVRKWRDVSKIKGGFDESKDPFDSFKLLIGLRGTVLHFRPLSEPHREDFQTDIERRLAEKYQLAEKMTSTGRYLNAPCADWAVTTTCQMIRGLYQLGYDVPTPYWYKFVDPPKWVEPPPGAIQLL